MLIPSNGLGEICATGRRGSEGWLDLFAGEDKICELHWDNRVERVWNDFEVLEPDERYKVEASGWSAVKGPLGHVFVDVSRAVEEEKEKIKEKVMEKVVKGELKGAGDVVGGKKMDEEVPVSAEGKIGA